MRSLLARRHWNGGGSNVIIITFAVTLKGGLSIRAWPCLIHFQSHWNGFSSPPFIEPSVFLYRLPMGKKKNYKAGQQSFRMEKQNERQCVFMYRPHPSSVHLLLSLVCIKETNKGEHPHYSPVGIHSLSPKSR